MQVNPYLFSRPSVYDFIDSSINCIILDNPNSPITQTKEYLLFYFVKQNFFANWMSLNNYNIDQDLFGFPVMHILTRHSIESFLDLLNLYADEEYINVMEFCAGQRNINTGKYERYKFQGSFTIQSKYKIASKTKIFECVQLFSKELNLINIAKDCNCYVHPNVHVNICSLEQKKEKLKTLLKTNLYLFIDSYNIIRLKFNKGIQPTFDPNYCNNVYCKKDCYNCLIDALKKRFEIIINHVLFENYTNTFYYF